MIETAKNYLQSGFSVIPIGKNERGDWKKPLVKWDRFQAEIPPERAVTAWWSQWPEARIGIVTGPVSNLVVVDIDPRHDGDVRSVELPATLTVRTGGGGWHYYYRHPGDLIVPNAAGIFPGIDIRGDGGYVVAPPSVHASGDTYEWTEAFDPSVIAECPKWILDTGSDQCANRDWSTITKGVRQGERNMSAASLVGKLLKLFDPHAAWDLLWAWNLTYNKPPLEEKELLATLISITNREYAKRARSHR